ncbi:SIMPL domain-containing protein [Lysinibacillus sp. LZ02]|uniref:SIMPL domain-containing protein n=1 Tax=Lysinibacillus sp. LZ02 TaxID=3420668 RepID=UPI003D35A5CF
MHCTNFHRRVLTVTGNGKVTAKASYIQIEIAVSTRGQDIRKAQQDNANSMNRVIQSILALNVPREAIQTAAYTISPTYDYIEGKQVFRDYVVTNAITVKVTDISQAGKVMDVAVQNGANRISSLQFQIENADVYYQQALSLALQNAQMKAKTIAETMHLPLYPQPIEIVEERTEAPALYREVAMVNEAMSTPIEQGEMTISATVRVKFHY